MPPKKALTPGGRRKEELHSHPLWVLEPELFEAVLHIVSKHDVEKIMVSALKPVLKDQAKAKQILERFWTDKMALVWDIQDVHTAANEREVALTKREAIKVLQELHHYHNKQTGIQWQDVTCYIEENAMGRKLTNAELKRFVEKNILTINRRR